jgi:bacteriorhodopsin
MEGAHFIWCASRSSSCASNTAAACAACSRRSVGVGAFHVLFYVKNTTRPPKQTIFRQQEAVTLFAHTYIDDSQHGL